MLSRVALSLSVSHRSTAVYAAQLMMILAAGCWDI